MELASAKYAQCRLDAESKHSKTLDAAKRASALARCSSRLGTAFAKATFKYGAACVASAPSSAFDAYLTQCSDDVAAAAAGAALPDHVGALASCNADLETATALLTTCEGDLAACETLPRTGLSKTGQTTSFGAGTDGDLQLGIAQTFIDNGDGTITDTSTGLMWEKKSDDGSIHDKDDVYTWSGASYGTTNELDGTVTSFLAALNAGAGFAGYTDWRLPNRKEMESLVNLEASLPATFPAFDVSCGTWSTGNEGCTVTTCSCTWPGLYWQSSTYIGAPGLAWIFDFGSGYIHADDKNVAYRVRAVRGGSSD